MRSEKEIREVLEFYEKALDWAENRYRLAQEGKIPDLTIDQANYVVNRTENLRDIIRRLKWILGEYEYPRMVLS